MRKSLRRVPELLREKTPVRRGVEEPQRVRAVSKRVHG
jgi:hypothetical protein